MDGEASTPRPGLTCPFDKLRPSQLVRDDTFYMSLAFNLAVDAWRVDEVPIGAVIVCEGEIIARDGNRTLELNDPTAHAEINAIRAACKKIADFDLRGASIYTSCEPCPMCLAAIYWARLDAIFYANNKLDAAAIQFDDNFIYQQLSKPVDERSIPMTQLLRDEASAAFVLWRNTASKTPY